MEVCGTHTMAIARSGLRSMLPENVELISGPGCPVCVTSQGEIDLFLSCLIKVFQLQVLEIYLGFLAVMGKLLLIKEPVVQM